VCARLAWLAAAVAPLAGCAAYEPPKPGTHRGPGQVALAEVRCGYETPTATRFVAMRCQTNERAQTEAELARELGDSLKTEVPRP
jgi:hypothetical protein